MDSIVVSTSTWHAGGPGSIPGHGRHGIFRVKLGSQHWEVIYIPCELEHHVNVGPVSIWDVKEDDKHLGLGSE